MPLLSIYNHLLQGHILMHQTRFDAHKKSELRDIYQNIRRLTAEQPLYKVTFDDEAQTFALGLKNSVLSLSSMLKELHINDGTSVFQSKTPVSNQPDIVDVSVLDGADTSFITEPLPVTVHSLCSSQKNEGRYVPADSSELPSGQYTFTIGVDKNLYSFQFNVSADSTNLDLQMKLSDFINKTSIGLKTAVVRQPELGLSRLELTSVLPGTSVESNEPAFILSDTKRPKGAAKGIIEHFNLNHIAKDPVNTHFSIDDKDYEIRGFDFLLNDALSLSFLQTTENPVTISARTDSAPVLEKLSAFFDHYNSTLQFVSESNNNRSKRFLAEFKHITGQYSEDLLKYGIFTSSNGALNMDTELATAAIANGSMENFFRSEQGFASAVLSKLSAVSLNPMEYLDKTVVTYPNINARKTYSPYITSIYSGLLYNNYC